MKRALLLSLLLLVVACSSVPVATTNVIAFATATATLSPITLGEVTIPNAKMEYYDIAGATEGDLRAEMNVKGPVGYDGYKGDATTKWFIRWTWPGFGTFFCTLNAASVSYQITVIFPRWKPPANEPPALITKWTNYASAVAEHEKGHVDFVVANYPSVLTAIQRATCETAEAAAQAALQPIRQHDIDYDAETNHGATQGARFP
jgi:predicted secreted Zn-dependent protease